MTQLAPYDGDVLPDWAERFTGIVAVAHNLALTPFVPGSLRDEDATVTTANVAAAILTGEEVGMPPMASLRSIVVINGTPALTALGLRGLVQSHGHTVHVVEATKTRAVVEGWRRLERKEDAQRVTWTMDDAKDRNLNNRPNWRMQPRNMLTARATAECCRLIAADVVLGLPYVVEELEDPDDPATVDDGSGGQDDPPPKRTARRNRARQNAALPSAPAEPDSVQSPLSQDAADAGAGEQPPPGPPGHVVMMTAEQRRALMALNRDLGLDRGGRVRRWRQITGREDIDSSSDLSYGEAAQILAQQGLDRNRQQSEPSADSSAGADRREDEGPDEAPLRQDEEDDPGYDEPQLPL